MKKSKRGGKRPGAGRPKSAPTEVITFRVEIKHVEPIKTMVKEYLKTRNEFNP